MPTELGSPPRWVGREREITYVRGLLHEAALGTGAATFFTGTDGCGKSRLLRECEEINSPALRLVGRCSAVPNHDYAIHAQLAEQLSLLRRREQTGRTSAIYSAIAALLKERPVAVLVDDVHLATATDIELLDALVFLAARHRLVLIASLADDAKRRPSMLSARLRQWLSQGATYRSLSPLDAKATTLLVRSLLLERGIESDGSAFGEIAYIAQGIPRYAVELAEQAAQTGHIGEFVPASAQMQLDAVRGTISRGAFDMLLLCSAIGERFRDDWIGRASEQTAATVALTLQEACDAGVLAEDGDARGWFSFRSRAIRRAVYHSMVSLRRRLLHERIIERLTLDDRDVEHAVMIANQWAALRHEHDAIEWFTRAADDRLRSGEFAQAAHLYRRAIAYLPEDSRAWLSVARPLLKCYKNLCEFDRTIPLAESICRHPEFRSDPAFAAEAISELFYGHLNNGNRQAADEIVCSMRSLDVPDDPELADTASLTLAYAFSAGGQRDEAAKLMETIEPQRLTSNTARWRYFIARGVIGVPHEPLEKLLEFLERAAAYGRRISIKGAFHAYVAAIDVAVRKGDLATAKIYGEKVTLTAAEYGMVGLQHEGAKSRTLVHVLAGELAEARRLLFSNLEWRKSGTYNEGHLAGLGVFVGMRTGDIALINALFEPALLAQAVAVREGEICGLLLSGFAEVMLVRGMTAQLQETIHTCLQQRLVDPYAWIHLSAARYAVGESLVLAERQMEDYVRDFDVAIAPAHAALFRAILARRQGSLDTSRELARRAAHTYGKLAWRLSEAVAWEFGDEPRKAMTIYNACGATADVSRVAAAQTRKLKRSPLGARLTPREREIASLIARKRADKEIAHALQISVRTVHHHVEAILSKLGTSDRTKVTQSLLDERLSSR